MAVKIVNRFSGATIWENQELADLGDADLSDADLSAADLRAAILSDADLSAADLRDANLSDADLSAANLRAAILSDADLSDADLSAADLRDADLRCKQYVCRIQGRRHAINAINDDVRIGCIRMSLADWLAKFEQIGQEQKYTAFEIAEYGQHLRSIKVVLDLWATAEENTERKA